MGVVAIIVKIMPDSPEADLEEIKSHTSKILEGKGAMNLSFEIVPIAFGLNAVKAKFAWPEAQDTEIIETSLSKIKHVSSAQIEDYRRAFG